MFWGCKLAVYPCSIIVDIVNLICLQMDDSRFSLIEQTVSEKDRISRNIATAGYTLNLF